jgi:DNA gyrase subunit A
LDGRPQILDLKQTLQAFIDYRINVIERRSRFELQKAQERLNILEGYIIALQSIDQVIATIRGSESTQEAATKLKAFDLNDAQVDAILQMRLQQLTRLEAGKINKEADEKRQEIQGLQQVLGDRAKLLQVLKAEINEVKEKYGDERRTEVRLETVNFDVEQVIQDEQVLVFLTKDGYVKRVSAKSFTALGRGSKGILSLDLKEQDKVMKVFATRTLQTVMFLTNQGRAYTMKAHEVPEATRSARGTPLINLLQLSEGEKVMSAVAIDAFTSTQFLTLVTQQGTVKRTPLDAFSNVRSSGIIATQFDENDTLAAALVTTGGGQIVIGTSEGLAIRFNESDISVMGRTAKGVVGVRLDEGSEVAGACFVPLSGKAPDILMVTKKGFGKRTPPEKYRLQRRGGHGVIALRIGSKTGNLIAIQPVREDNDVLTVSEKGQAVRLAAESIPHQGRASSGVRIARLDEGDRIASVTAIPAEAAGQARSGQE